MTDSKTPGARQPLRDGEMFFVWFVARAGMLLCDLGRLVLLRPFRARTLSRERLGPSQHLTLVAVRSRAVAEIGRFIADPLGFDAESSTPSRWPLGGLAEGHVGFVVRAQAHALHGRNAEAIDCMTQALARLEPADAVAADPWMRDVLRPKATPRQVQSRGELAALARAFIAAMHHAQGRTAEAFAYADRACDDHPEIAYLHEARAELLSRSGLYDDAVIAFDRGAALRGVGASSGARLATATAIARMAVNAAVRTKWNWAADERAEAARLLDRAAVRLDPPDVLKMPGASRLDQTAAMYWRGRLAVERMWLRQALRDPPANDRDHATDAFAQAAGLADDDAWRQLAKDWLAVVQGRPWRALHDALQRSDAADPLTDDIGQALLDAARPPDPLHRVVLEVDEALLPAAMAERLLADRLPDRPADADTMIDIETFKSTFRETVGFDPPSILLRRIAGGERGRVDLLLDGVPIDSDIVPDTRQKRFWFGEERELEAPEAIISVLARGLLRHLDRLPTIGVAQELGLRDFDRSDWAPLLGVLLAGQTPLPDRAALRDAVAACAWRGASTVEAARWYRLRVASGLCGVKGTWRHASLPDQFAAQLASSVAGAGDALVLELPEAAASALDAWVDVEVKAASTPPLCLVVESDPGIAPWLRALVRRRHPDLPVVTREELIAALPGAAAMP